jgi:hypothetical protein
MRLTIRFVCAAVMLAWLAGCTEERSTAPLPDRLKAAQAIQDPGQRDSALVKVAKDAAEAGEGEVVKGAIASIKDPGTHDNTAVSCAPLLMKAGKGTDATEVAKSIRDPGTRDSALSKLAGGR